MSNLLDKASIILTPTAYNNGEALCVKPSDGSGDFDFSRNSAATRVNAQGLVENVQILSSNLVQNGDFSEEGVEEVSNGSFSQEGSELVTNGDFSTDSDWQLTQATISNGEATFATTDGSFAGIRQNVFTIGKTYLISIEVSNLVGTAEVNTNGGTSIGLDITSVGTKSFYMVANSTDIEIKRKFGITNVSATIDNVSVREVGQDWTLGTGWSIGEDKASSDGSQTSNSSLFQPNVLTQNKYYKFEFTLSNVTSGSVRLRNGIGDSETYISYQNSNGTYTAYTIVNSSNKTLVVDADSSFTGSITNISVKEVGQNWALDANWSIGNNLVTTDGTINSNFEQDAVTTIGQTYKYSFDVLNSGGGVIDGRFRNGGGFIQNFSSEGTYTGTFVAYNTLADFTTLSGNTASFSITNISVIEITDDTNLPRINYEGFSYDGSGNVVPDSGCGSWLFEPQSTNLITQSELFSDAFWTKFNSSVSSGFISPDGLTNASKLIASVSNTAHKIRSSVMTTPALGTAVTFSIYCKPQEITKIAIVDNWTDLTYGVVNLSTNSVIEEAFWTGTGSTSITEMANGFKRILFTYQTSHPNTFPAFYLLDDAYTSGNPTSYTFASDGTSGVYIWGAQFEAQSYPTSLIPTSGSTVTRNQDVCTNGGSLASINSTSGVLYAEIAALADDLTNRDITLSDGSSSNFVKIRYNSNNSNWIYTRVNVGGSLVYSNINLNNVITDFNKIAIRYQDNNFATFINGVKVGSQLSGSAFGAGVLTTLDFDNGTGSQNLFGKTKALAVWKEALSDAELTELTTI